MLRRKWHLHGSQVQVFPREHFGIKRPETTFGQHLINIIARVHLDVAMWVLLLLASKLRSKKKHERNPEIHE